MTFGEALKRFRKAAKMTQAELAILVKVSQPTIGLVEVGKRNSLAKDTVLAIESALRLQRGELIKYLPQEHPAHTAVGAEMPNRGIVWGSPPKDVPDPVPGATVTLVGRYPSDAFALQVSGSSIQRWGIYDGDLIVVRPATEPRDKTFIVARQGGAYTIKGYYKGQLYAWGPGDDAPKPIKLTEDTEIVGVMIAVLDGEREFYFEPEPAPASKAASKKKPK